MHELATKEELQQVFEIGKGFVVVTHPKHPLKKNKIHQSQCSVFKEYLKHRLGENGQKYNFYKTFPLSKEITHRRCKNCRPWVLTCFEWNNNGIQLGDGQTGTRTVSLVSDHSWSEGYYKVTDSGLHVDFNFVSKLKHGSAVKQTVVGSDSTSFFQDTTHSAGIGQSYNNPKDPWHYSIQYSVTNII